MDHRRGGREGLYRPRTLEEKVIGRICESPYLLPNEIAATIRGRDGELSSVEDVIDVLQRLGFDDSSERETLVSTRWAWEVIFAQNIASFDSSSTDPNTWINDVALQLEARGVSPDGARLWVQTQLQKLHIRVTPGSENCIDPTDSYQINLLRNVSLSTHPRVPENMHDQERVSRFTFWAATRLMVALNQECTAEWGPPINGESVATYHMLSIFKELFGRSYRNQKIQQWAYYAVGDAGMLRGEVRALYYNWWQTTGGWPESVGLQRLRSICKSMVCTAETASFVPPMGLQRPIANSVDNQHADAELAEYEPPPVLDTKTYEPPSSPVPFSSPAPATVAPSHTATTGTTLVGLVETVEQVKTTVATLPPALQPSFASFQQTIDALLSLVQHMAAQLQQVALLARETASTSELWRVQVRTLQAQQRTLEQSLLAEFVLRWSLGEEKKQSQNSGLNTLYRWATAEDSAKDTTTILARGMLARFQELGVVPIKTQLVGKTITLEPNAAELYNFVSGPRYSDYNGQGHVLTPEWRFGDDTVLEQSWVKLPPVRS